jgi:cell shape-determining protein MreD
VRLLRAIVGLALAVSLQVGLGSLWPDAHRYVDLLLVPVVWYGIVGSQRSAMLIGCCAGLLQDAWFDIGVFGLNGFKRTLLGWTLGGLGARFDLNRRTGWLAAGALLSLADSLMDLGLRRLLDLEQAAPNVVEMLIRAAVAGILVSGAFGLQSRARQRKEQRRFA